MYQTTRLHIEEDTILRSHQYDKTRTVSSSLILMKACFSGRREVCVRVVYTVHTSQYNFLHRTHQYTPQGLDIPISKRPRLYDCTITL